MYIVVSSQGKHHPEHDTVVGHTVQLTPACFDLATTVHHAGQEQQDRGSEASEIYSEEFEEDDQQPGATHYSSDAESVRSGWQRTGVVKPQVFSSAPTTDSYVIHSGQIVNAGIVPYN